MSDSKKPYEHDQLTHEILGAAYTVHSELGPGLMEKNYEKALSIELAERGLRFDRQKQVLMFYKGVEVGECVPDIVVEDKVILELKSVSELAPVHTAQLMTYLRASKIRTGLLINFNVVSLKSGIRRVSV